MSLPLYLLVVVVPVVVALAIVGAYRANRRATEKMHQGFEQSFPERCSICAYHRYGLQYGHVRSWEEVPSHWCKEKGRWLPR